MIYGQVELFNVEEVEAGGLSPGLRLYRFPRIIREKAGHDRSYYGRYISMYTTGCEIRFVTEGPMVSVKLSGYDNDGEIIVCKGDLYHSRHRLQKGIISNIMLNDPPVANSVEQIVFEGHSFAYNVWRIIFCHDFIGVFHGIEDYGFKVRPPLVHEAPRTKWLAYGSSITHGAGASAYTSAYIMQAARALKVDVLNKGMGGSCLCEREMADYIAQNKEWDFATLELGVNMRPMFGSGEFEEYAGYLVATIMKGNPEKHIFLITVFPNYADFYKDKGHVDLKKDKVFSEAIRKIYQEFKDERLHLIEGPDVLKDLSGLTCDMIHPSDYGHIAMGRELAKRLRETLKEWYGG